MDVQHKLVCGLSLSVAQIVVVSVSVVWVVESRWRRGEKQEGRRARRVDGLKGLTRKVRFYIRVPLLLFDCIVDGSWSFVPVVR